MTGKKKSSSLAWLYIIAGLLYLTNLTFGIIEFLPDNIPLFGNIDEGISGALVYYGIQKLRGK